MWDRFRSDSNYDLDESSLASVGQLSEAEKKLVVRLVGTSHGRGRSAFDSGVEGLCADKELNQKLDSSINELFGFGLWEGLVARTDELYGYWGVAYLEAIVRAADARESAAEQGGGFR